MGKDKKIVRSVSKTVCEPIKDWPKAERPREKLLQLGPEAGRVVGYQRQLNEKHVQNIKKYLKRSDNRDNV